MSLPCRKLERLLSASYLMLCHLLTSLPSCCRPIPQSVSSLDVYSGSSAVPPMAKHSDAVLFLSQCWGLPIAPGTESIQIYHGLWYLE